MLLTGAQMRAFTGAALVARGRAARLAYHRDTGVAAADEAWFEVIPVEGLSNALVLTHGPLELRAAEVRGRVGGTIRALGGVRLQSRSGIDATTPTATFEPEGRTLRGTEGVVATRHATHLSADRFLFDLAAETFDFRGNVETHTGVAAP